MKPRRIALIAHDNKKELMVKWAQRHESQLLTFECIATRSTGELLEKATQLKIQKYKSGPLGGDLQIGGQIVDGNVAALFFFWDPLSPHSHDVDVKALLRIAVVYDVPMACNVTTADAVLASL